MKKIVPILGWAAVVLAGGCLEQTGPGPRSYKGPLFRYHFAGRTHLSAGTNATRLKEIDALPATTALRGQIAEKLAAAAWPFWQKDLPAGAANQSVLLRPLWDDFLVAEAYLEVRGAPGRTDTALAIELNDERAQLWSARLTQLLAAWKLGTPRDIAAEGFKGWEVKKPQAPNTFQFFRAGKWVLLGLGQDSPAQLPDLLRETRKAGRPLPVLNSPFLDLAVDFPGLRPWFPIFARYALPPIQATMSGRGENVRTEVKFQYSGNLPWVFEPWKIPTNIISEPLTSFTLAQGIAPWLSQVKGLAEVGLSPLPNQFCSWGVDNPQWRSFFTVPVPDSTNAIRQIASRLPQFIRSRLTNARGEFLYYSNRAELRWANLPFIQPILRPEKEGRNEFLFGADFPLAAKHAPVTDELFAQVGGRTNLIYYDWELTQERLNHSKQFYQLTCIVDRRHMPSTNTVSKRWLSSIGPKLGNTVTEVTRTGPRELALVRQSHLGLTGFELATLSTWLDSPGFPFSFGLPPPLPDAVTNAPAARTGPPANRTNPLPAKGTLPAKTNSPPTGKR